MQTPTSQIDRVDAALDALQNGEPILVFDAEDREGETDLVYASEHVDAAAIARLRTAAGGLLCTTLAPHVHQTLRLPYLADVLRDAAHGDPFMERLTEADVPYEDASNQKPSFGLTVNHRDTFTGVTDADRAHTIGRLADLTRRLGNGHDDEIRDTFAAEFKTPGHVILLNAHPRLLDGRRGHTELATALVEMAGLAPSATICEMMDGPGGAGLSKQDAVKYAARNGHVFLTGDEVITRWRRAKTTKPPGRNGHASA